jgi:hypothetical protein
MIYNVKLVDFNDIFQKLIQKDILDNLFNLKLISENKIHLRNKDTKQVITNYINFHISKMLKIVTLNKIVLIVQPHVFKDCEIENYCDKELLQHLLLKILKSIQKIYSKQIFIFKVPVEINSIDLQFTIFHKINQY